MLRSRLAALALVGACGLAACTDAPSTPAPAPDAVSDLGGCLFPDEAELSLHRTASVVAAVGILGDGPGGVVVSYEMNGSVCPWLPLARRLAADGHTALLYERVDGPESAYVEAMVDLLRERGVERYALVGGSIGGIMSISAAGRLDPPPAAVVSLSGADQGTVVSTRTLRVPLLQVVARDGAPFAGFAAATDRAAVGSPGHRLVVRPGAAHASLLFSVDPTVLPRVVRYVETRLGDLDTT